MSSIKAISSVENPDFVEPEALDVPLVQHGLSVARFGTPLHYFREIGSTNSHARELAEAGAAEGTVVVAESQSHGRGRLGRRWESPPFKNLYLSIVLRPNLSPAHAAQITLVAAVALADAVEFYIPGQTAIKWPNDILVGGKKLAGILTEASCDAELLHYVILGVGINLNFASGDMPDGIRRRATSLLEVTGKPIRRESFLQRLLQGIERCYGELEQTGFAAVATRWEDYFAWRGRRVRVELLDQVTVGTARGIDRDGALLLVDESGNEQRILAGDVIPLEN
ncbi:MAG TPA: biotin--[acetyl-CoA-carboxylase] ligase [Candidatus Binatia bacterium]|nr:biotin--[acetyl-CoA-carboxylase] ligase [Candidatus Binatia bacterium]